ncbi:hypothetical protein EJB05_15570, partial [Eragrostis curvula]
MGDSEGRIINTNFGDALLGHNLAQHLRLAIPVGLHLVAAPEAWRSRDWRKAIDYHAAVLAAHLADSILAPASPAVCLSGAQEVLALRKVDVSGAVAVAKKRSPPLVVAGDERRLPFESNSVNFVFAGRALDSAKHPSDLAAEAARILKPEAHLVVLTCPSTPPWKEPGERRIKFKRKEFQGYRTEMNATQGTVNSEKHGFVFYLKICEFVFYQTEVKEGTFTSELCKIGALQNWISPWSTWKCRGKNSNLPRALHQTRDRREQAAASSGVGVVREAVALALASACGGPARVAPSTRRDDAVEHRRRTTELDDGRAGAEAGRQKRGWRTRVASSPARATTTSTGAPSRGTSSRGTREAGDGGVGAGKCRRRRRAADGGGDVEYSFQS